MGFRKVQAARMYCNTRNIITASTGRMIAKFNMTSKFQMAESNIKEEIGIS